MLFQLKTACSTAHAPLGEGPRSKDTKRQKGRVSLTNIFSNPLQKKKGRQTCWSFLLILLTLVAVVELSKGLGRLLQPRHKHLDVIQGAVEDLLRGEKVPDVQHERGATGEQRERRGIGTLTTSISILWISLSCDSGSCFPDPRLSAPRTQTMAPLVNKLLVLHDGTVGIWCR